MKMRREKKAHKAESFNGYSRYIKTTLDKLKFTVHTGKQKIIITI